jgi:hypothetical protein
MPKRIQRRRVKGWRMPENTVSVARPGRWGNPYKVGRTLYRRKGKVHTLFITSVLPCSPYDQNYEAFTVTVEVALGLFRQYAKERAEVQPSYLSDLRGRDLACFCKDGEPCHGDVLLELANEEAA